MNQERKIRKLQERIDKRDRRIKWLERRIIELENNYAPNLGRSIEFGIGRILSNMRMIPVLGLCSEDRVIDVVVKKSGGSDE
jgi:hypothetical protein